MEIIDGGYELDIDPQKLCRLCLSQPQQLQNIFTSSAVDGGYILSIPDMISYAVDIAVTSDDKLPAKICLECKKQIKAFYLFKQKAKRTEQSLISMFSPESAVDNNITASITCSMCDIAFENESAFEQHSQQEHPDYDVIEVDNSKIIKTKGKPQAIEIFDFDSMTNGDNSESEIITDDVNIEEQDMLAVEEEPVIQVIKRTRSRTASAKVKLEVENEPKAKRVRLSEKPTTSKMNVKPEVSDTDENVDLNDDFDFDNTGSESLTLFECPLCSTQFADREEYMEHCKEHEISDYQCYACKNIFEDESQLLQHDCESNEINDDDDLICIPCNKRMKSSAQLRQHSKLHDSMNLIINYLDFFPCHDCCMLFISREKFNEHMMSTHPEKNIKELEGISDTIDESCTDYQFLDDDKQTEYKEGELYSCGECMQQYQTIHELKYHAILHANKYECPIEECGCQYDQISRLSIHVLNKHINTKNLQCLHCSQSFATYDDLQSHLKHFCKEKKFKCYECDKKFFSKKALITHLRTLKEKKFKCKTCGKAFKQQGELTIHTRSHTNERPFQCTICNKSYKTSSMRAAHMDSHISGKTFECQLCEKKLQSRTSYRNHMKRHTEEKKHVCEHCSKRFFTRYHLRLHQSKIHKGIVTDSDTNTDLAQLIDDDNTMIVFE